MTFTLTLKSSTKVKFFETYQIRKTSQNMLGYYAQGIIYCWEVKGQGQAKIKFTELVITSRLIVTETLNLIHVLVYEKPHHI